MAPQSGPPSQGPPQPSGKGPYILHVWQFGGTPEINPDLYICAVFLALYVGSAVTHMTIFQRNKKRSHFFALSAMTFGFSMSRIFTITLRISWSVKKTNPSIALGSQIFVTAGTPLLYVINLIFAHRIVRAQHPKLGWHKSLSILSRMTVVSVVTTLALLIFAGVMMSFTLNTHLRQKCRDIQLFGTTFYTFIAFLPLLMILISFAIPKRIQIETFGKGKLKTKVVVLLTSTFLLTLRAVWATIASWQTPVPRIEAIPWYYSKAAFYSVQLLPELLVVYLYALIRVDQRFYTPTGQRNSYLVIPGTANRDKTAALISGVKGPETAYHGYTGISNDCLSGNLSRHTSNAANSMNSSAYKPIREYSEEELASETSTLALPFDSNVRFSYFSDRAKEKEKFELREGDHDGFYHRSADYACGSRSNVNTRDGTGRAEPR